MKPRIFQFLFFLFFCLFSGSIFSQESQFPKIDSLLKLIPAASDTDKINLKNELALEYLWEKGDPDSSLIFSLSALKEAKQLNYAPGIAQSYLNFGIVSSDKGDFLQAHEQYKLALYALKDLEKEQLWAKLLVAEIYNNTAHNFGEQFNYTKAVDYYLKSLRIFEPIAENNIDGFIAHVNAKGENISKERITNDFINNYLKKNPLDKQAKNMISFSGRVLADIRYTCKNISSIFMRIGDHAKAIEYLKKGVKIAEDVQANDSYMELTDGIANAHFVMHNFDTAIYYYNKIRLRALQKNNMDYLLTSNDGIARSYAEKSDFKNALAYYDTTYAILAPLNSEVRIGVLSFQKATIYTKQGDLEQALNFYKDAWMRFQRAGGNEHNLIMCNWRIGNIYVKSGKTVEGIKLMSESLPFLEQENGQDLPDYYKQISEAYEKIKDINNAFYYFKKYVQLNDSITGELKGNAISELQKRFDVEKKDTEIELLNKDNDKKAVEIEKQKVVRNLIIGGLSIVLILGAIVFRSLRLNKKKNKLITQQKNEMERQKEIVEEKQKEILDSIY
ncbi:MAG: tetratricopeptide repeat protein, partial [Bacteroidia bacterium]|nr:tetratricopeptide repeat protein [Bacteroidia bacterium]